MAELYSGLEKVPTYYDRRTCTSLEDWNEAVRNSRAVYVGNLNYFTTEEELYEVCRNSRNINFTFFLPFVLNASNTNDYIFSCNTIGEACVYFWFSCYPTLLVKVCPVSSAACEPCGFGGPNSDGTE